MLNEATAFIKGIPEGHYATLIVIYEMNFGTKFDDASDFLTFKVYVPENLFKSES